MTLPSSRCASGASAVFTLAHILLSSIRSKSDFRKVLLGDRYPA